MSELQFTSVDRILSKLYRETKDDDLNETDAIEWIGEALDFLRVVQMQEEVITFVEVKNYTVNLPKNFQMVLQIARNNMWDSDNKYNCGDLLKEIVEKDEKKEKKPIPLDCQGKKLTEDDFAYYRPNLAVRWSYGAWVSNGVYKEKFTPVRLANNTFFDTLVCKEKDQGIYKNCNDNCDKYTIVGTTKKKLRFNFEKGQIALAYVKTAVDDRSGYPLVPDNQSALTAITYYIKWKLAEQKSWRGREGWQGIADKAEQRWLNYAKQFKSYMKMPKSIDDYQDLLEQSHYLIPRLRRYYGYFGSLGQEEILNNTIYNE